MSLWTFFVVNVFGSFWAAVIALMIIYYIILVMGAVSQDTCLTYCYIFLLFMVIGYGFIPFSILMTVLTLYLNLMVLPRMINRASQ